MGRKLSFSQKASPAKTILAVPVCRPFFQLRSGISRSRRTSRIQASPEYAPKRASSGALRENALLLENWKRS